MPRTPIHPGEHLAEELRELGMSAAELSRQIDVPVNRITGIIHGQRGITAEDAVNMIVSGFCKEVFRELPMEFAVEAQKLLSVSLEGSVG